MSGKKSKIQRKIARTEITPVIKAETEAARILIKSKPWWMPHFAWAFMLNKFAEAKKQAGVRDE